MITIEFSDSTLLVGYFTDEELTFLNDVINAFEAERVEKARNYRRSNDEHPNRVR